MDEGISSLPAPILHHILSFLDNEKEAVRTCVLSKSWRHLVSTRPNLSLCEYKYLRGGKEKFIDVLDKSLQVYSDQKLCIEEFRVIMSTDNPGLVLLLDKWIPKVVMKKFHLSFSCRPVDLGLPYSVFESESLQEIKLERCNLRQIQKINNSIGNNNHHLKTLTLQFVCIEDEESFAKIMSSCSSIEDLSLHFCKGPRTINMPNHHNLKSFKLYNYDDNDGTTEIYLPSTIGYISIHRCPNWFHHRNYFPGLTCLKLTHVPLSNEWFDSFSFNFPCLEDLQLCNCNGFDELKLSSRSIKNLYIKMDMSTMTTKATIDAPSIKMFRYHAKISQSISFTTTPRSMWKSQINLSLDLDASLWFLKISEVVAAFSQSQINSLGLFHFGRWNEQHIEHLSDTPVCCSGSYKMPVAIGSLELIGLNVHRSDFFFSDLVNGLFRLVRPSEIRQYRKEEFLCRTPQMAGRPQEDEGMISVWQHDLEEVSLEVKNSDGLKEWHHPVQGTKNWPEYVSLLFRNNQLRVRLKWKA